MTVCFLAPARAAIGDVSANVTLAVTPVRFAHQIGFHRYHVVTTGGMSTDIYKLNANGSVYKHGQALGLGSQLLAASTRGMAAPSDSTWVTLDDYNTLTWWTIGEDTNGDLTIAKGQTRNLSGLIRAGEQIASFDYSPEGGFWFGVHSTIEGRNGLAFQTDSNVATIKQTINLRSVLDPFSHIFTVETADPVVRIDQLNGNLIAMGYHTMAYVSHTSGTLVGLARNDLANSGVHNSSSASGAAVLLNSAHVVHIEMSYPLLPSISGEPTCNYEGVAWTYFSGPTGSTGDDWTMTIPVMWGTGGRDTLSSSAGFGAMGSRVITSQGALPLNSVVFTDSAITIAIDPYYLASYRGPGPNGFLELTIELVNGSGQPMAPVTLTTRWTAYAGPVGVDPKYFSKVAVGDTIKWQAVASMPPNPINATFKVPDGSFFLAGKTFGIKDLQFNGEYSFQNKDPGALGASGGGSFELGTGSVSIKGGGAALPELTAQGIDYRGGKGFLEIRGSVKDQIGWTQAFPTLTAFFSLLPGSSRILNWLDSRAQLYAELGVNANPTVALVSVPGAEQLGFNGDLSVGIDIKAGTTVNIMDMLAEAQAFGQGSAQVVFQAKEPDYSPTFKEFTLTLLMQGQVTTWIAQKTLSQAWQFKYDPVNGPVINDSSRSTNAWRTQTVTLDDSPPHYTFSGGVAMPRVAYDKPAPAAAATTDTETTILANISTNSTPAMAAAPDGTQLVVWSQEVAGRKPTQATDIYYSYFNGASYTTPKAIHVDTNIDFTPQIAWHKSGKWIALWTRGKKSDIASTGDVATDLAAVTSQFVPAWSVYTPATDTWTPPLNLFDTPICVRPKLATGASHDVTAVFIKSGDGNVITEAIPLSTTSTTPPSNLYFSRFASGAFQTTQTILSENFIEYDAMETGSELYIAWTRNGNLYTGIHTQPGLMYGSITMRLARRTHSDGIVNQGYGYSANGSNDLIFAPRLFQLHDGAKRLTWVSHFYGGAIHDSYALLTTGDLPNFSTGNRILVQDPSRSGNFGSGHTWEESTWDRCTPGESADGAFYVAFSDIANGRANMRIVFDDPAGVPSGQGLLINDDAVEKRICAVGNTSGKLIVSYLKLPMTIAPAQVQIGDKKYTVSALNVSNTGALKIFTHTIRRDLSVSPVKVQSGLLMAGHTVQLAFDVTNSGDLSAANAVVNVYVQKLANRPTPLAISSSVGLAAIGSPILIANRLNVGGSFLPGFTTQSVIVNWSPPDNGIYQAWVVVDPDNTVAESDETNNQSATAVLSEPPAFGKTELTNHLLGIKSFPAIQKPYADLNGDGKIDIADMVRFVIEKW